MSPSIGLTVVPGGKYLSIDCIQLRQRPLEAMSPKGSKITHIIEFNLDAERSASEEQRGGPTSLCGMWASIPHCSAQGKYHFSITFSLNLDKALTSSHHSPLGRQLATLN